MTDYYDRWPFMAEHTDGFYEEVIGVVLEHCDPRAVWIFFPEPFDETDDWYEGSDVCLCIVIDGGDTREVRWDVREALAGHRIDGYVIACTTDEFERYKDDSYSSIHDVYESGYVAYTREG